MSIESDVHPVIGGERPVSTPDMRIESLASRQHGVVSRAQLRCLGVTDPAIDHRLANGRLSVLHRGVFAVGHRALRAEAHWMAAVLAAGAGSLLSHRSAAALWGIRPTSRARVDVIVPFDRRSRPGLDLHLSTVETRFVTLRAGIPLTSVERTLVDLAAVIRPDGLRRAVERAEIDGLVDWRILDELVEAGRRRRGIRALRAIVTSRDIATSGTRSALERDFLALLRAHGLPSPQTNVVVAGYEVDCYWPQARLAVEVDGREVHDTVSAFERDRARDRALLLVGVRVVRVTRRQVRHAPHALAADLRRLIQSDVFPP